MGAAAVDRSCGGGVVSTREFTFGLKSLLRASRTRYSTRTRLWPLCVAWTAVVFVWWRGVYYPIADRLNIIFWYYGWFGRWKARPGDVITVHGTPAVVCTIDHRALTVTTGDGSKHDRPHCCAPWEAP